MTFTTKPDYWSILGLSPGSDLTQIKRAFRKEARRWHPDLNLNDVNAEERFKLVNEAYAILSDPVKRSAWEQNSYGEVYTDELFTEGFPTYEEYINIVLGIESDQSEYYEENDNESSILTDDSFNHSIDNPTLQHDNSLENSYIPTKSFSQPKPIKRNKDQETLLDLTPEEALYGTSVQIQLIDGTLVEVDTPPFAGDGWRLRLSGVVIGGEDHFLQLRVQTTEGLRIDGLRVLYKLELFPQDALFGCAVDIPTLDGSVTLQVPPNSSSGRLLRLRGRGLEYDELCGDQIVEITVVIPAELTDSELALYRRLQELAFDETNS